MEQFYKSHKALVIVGGLLLAYLVYEKFIKKSSTGSGSGGTVTRIVDYKGAKYYPRHNPYPTPKAGGIN